MTKEENIEVFENTVDICMESDSLKESIKNSRNSQKVILEKDKVPDGSKIKRFSEACKIVISKKRTFEAASAYVNANVGSASKEDSVATQKICVLNFASSTNPGGGVETGSRAQEESLCRISTLFFCLDTDEMWEKFYNPHRALHSPLHNDDIIYTPDVKIIKSDTDFPQLMEEKNWFSTDVITCAAPNLREKPSNRYNSGDGNQRLILSDEELYALHKKRDRRIFDVAVQNNVDVLILGAFGCGAFRNNPEIVARTLLELANKYKYAFKVIEFAVYCPPFDDSNYQVFKKAGL